MKKIEIEIPEGKVAKWVNGILTLVDDENIVKLPITERIKTFQDAVIELGDSHPFVQEYEMVQGMDCSPQSNDFLAYLQLRIITAAINEGWKPQFTEGERRYYPYFYLLTKEEYDKLDEEERSRVVLRSGNNAHAYGGVAYAHAHDDSAHTYAISGSRLAFRTRELALFAGKQFIDIWADYCFRID